MGQLRYWDGAAWNGCGRRTSGRARRWGRLPREDAYVAADQSSPNKKCAPEPRNLVDPGGNRAEGYSPCVPLYPPDVDCPDVNGPVTVTGSDLHGLDTDNDGVACEW